VQRLHDEVAKAMNEPAMKQVITKLGANPMPAQPGRVRCLCAHGTGVQCKLIKAAGIEQN